MINSVCLLGSAAGRNAGDAALISGIMEAIDLRLKRRLLYRVPTLFPRFVEQTYRHNRVEAINVMPWTGSLKLFGWPTYRAVTQSDLSLVFDAVLFDRSLFNPMFNFLSSLYFLLPAAKKAGRRVGLYNCGVGPITTSLGAKMLKRVCDSCDFITVREEGSAEVLRRIWVPDDRFIVTADAALNAPGISEEEIASIYRRIGLDPSQEILAININKYLNTWSEQSGMKLDVNGFLDLLALGDRVVALAGTAALVVVARRLRGHDLHALGDRHRDDVGQVVLLLGIVVLEHLQRSQELFHIKEIHARIDFL